MRKWITLFATVLCSGALTVLSTGCRVVDAVAPRQMSLTFEPADVTMQGQRALDPLVGLVRVTCNFQTVIQAHGGRPSDYLGLVGVTSTWYNTSGFATNSSIDLAENWFGTDRLKYDERSTASRYATAYGPFTVRMALKYVDPDGATKVETMTVNCQ